MAQKVVNEYKEQITIPQQKNDIIIQVVIKCVQTKNDMLKMIKINDINNVKI